MPAHYLDMHLMFYSYTSNFAAVAAKQACSVGSLSVDALRSMIETA